MAMACLCPRLLENRVYLGNLLWTVPGALPKNDLHPQLNLPCVFCAVPPGFNATKLMLRFIMCHRCLLTPRSTLVWNLWTELLM